MGRAEEIYIELRRRLENGVYAPGGRFPSESMLADEFSVNKMTMNKVVSMLAEQRYLVRGIRGAGTRVSDLRLRFRGTIAFMAPLNPYTIRILSGVYGEALRRNFAVLAESPLIADLQLRMMMLKSSGVCGIVSASYGVPVQPEGMIQFCVDSSPMPSDPARPVYFINSDNYLGGVQMMNEIIRRGHREILIFSSERDFRSNVTETPRIRGFHRIMAEHGIADFEARTFYGGSSVPDAKRFLKSGLKKFPSATLIAADSDGSAELVHSAALELGIDCPGRIALTGFGNVTQLPIANVNQNPERQGELAARYLIDGILRGCCSAPACELVETDLTGVEYIPIRLS